MGGTLTADATQLSVDISNFQDPPTESGLTAVFGTPASVGAGFSYLIDDAGSGATMYVVTSDGNNWHYSTYTKAVNP